MLDVNTNLELEKMEELTQKEIDALLEDFDALPGYGNIGGRKPIPKKETQFVDSWGLPSKKSNQNR